MYDIEKLSSFIQLLANREDLYYIYRPGCNGWKLEREELTAEQIENHLNGIATISLPALSPESTAKWLAFDFDDNSGDLYRVRDYLASAGWQTLHHSNREGRDGHLLLVFALPVPGALIRRFAKEVISRCEIQSPDKLEVFPKQDLLKEDQVGNGLRMPIGINQKIEAKGQRGWIEGVETKIEVQLDYLLSLSLNSSERLVNISKALIKVDEDSKKKEFNIGSYIVCRRGNREKKEKTNLLDVLPQDAIKRSGNGYLSFCPACRSQGNDRKGTNLWISSDGLGFKCFRNNGEHTTIDILNSLPR